jgi:endoglucanase
MFEGGNEEIGDRLNDVLDSKIDSRLDVSIKYSSKGNLTENQCYILAGKINQKFVDLIRSQGSKNTDRFLLIPGYNTDIDKTCDSRFKMPSDKTNSIQKLIVSVHYYKPETYCLVNDPKNSWGYMDSWPGYDSNFNTDSKQNYWFRKLNKFTEQGYGVIIGEYGVSTKKDGSKKQGMEAWMTSVLENCEKYNYCPMLWDCNTFFKKNGNILGFTDSDIAAVYLSK